MGNNIKQIYVAIELSENEIKLLVGEYYNTRFNIIRAERFATNAISDFKISNKEELSADIRNAINQTSAKIGAKIEKRVDVFLAETDDAQTVIQKEEIEDYIWLRYPDALNMLRFDNDKEILMAAQDYMLAHDIC